MTRLNTLQLLRGYAALAVVLYHATGLFKSFLDYDYLFGVFRIGESGVDVFFVLSGLVIFYIHHKDIGKNEKTKYFLKKRIVRIYPIYWLILFIIVPVYFAFPAFGSADIRNVENLFKSFILIPQSQDSMPLGAAWTLSHEMLFYLMFVFLIATSKKISFPVVGLWVILSICNFLGWNFISSIENPYYQFIVSPFNLEFIAGVIIAYLIINKRTKYGYTFTLLGVVGFIIVGINDYFNYLEIQRVVEYGLPAALLIFGMVSIEINSNIRTPHIFIYLGDASYSIYLVHGFALSFGNKVFSSLNLYENLGLGLSTSLLVVISIVCGCILHSYVEKPLLSYLNYKVLKPTKKLNVKNYTTS